MKRRVYLYRLSILVLLALFVPSMVFFLLFWSSSSDELSKNSEAYYQKIVESFMTDFEATAAVLQEKAVELTADSMDHNSVFYQGAELFRREAYWYIDAIRDLDEYYLQNRYGALYGGLYYYDIDKIIARSTYSTEGYVRHVLDAENADTAFFDADNFSEGNWIYGTTHGNSPNGSLLMGYGTKMGKYRDNVLVFYTLSSENFDEVTSVIYREKGIDFYILNRDTDEICLALNGQAEAGVDLTGREEGVYRIDSEKLPLSFIAHIREDSLQNSAMKYYTNMRNLLLVAAIFLLGICLLVIFLAYKPVNNLIAELDYNDGNEFEMIRNIINERGTKIYEHEMLIMDLLINHLIYGVPISEKRLTRLGVTEKMKHYCVLILDGYVLLASDTECVSDAVSKCHARIFATNWQGEQRSVLILFMEEDNMEEVLRVINNWLVTHVTAAYNLLRGNLVDRVDDIRSSFLSCEDEKGGLQIHEKASDISPQGEKQKRLKKEILAYLEQHYRDEDLSQTKVADAFHVSNYTLSRVFKNQVGVGFAEYVNGKRLETAKELLLTTDHSVKEIALMVGMTNEKYFFKVFKTSTGMTPTEFRAQE